MSYGQHVGAEDMRRCLGTVRDLMGQLKSGFLLMTDLSNLESMEPSCAPELGAVMDLCSARGMLTEMRVIPDPSKDIGFVLISRFHHHPPVKTETYESLAEAIKSLCTEALPPGESAEIPSSDEAAIEPIPKLPGGARNELLAFNEETSEDPAVAGQRAT